jgi:hypothetical protein
MTKRLIPSFYILVYIVFNKNTRYFWTGGRRYQNDWEGFHGFGKIERGEVRGTRNVDRGMGRREQKFLV